MDTIVVIFDFEADPIATFSTTGPPFKIVGLDGRCNPLTQSSLSRLVQANNECQSCEINLDIIEE